MVIAFYICILLWLAGLDIFQPDCALHGPLWKFNEDAYLLHQAFYYGKEVAYAADASRNGRDVRFQIVIYLRLEGAQKLFS